ncbi:BA14K family protein [Shinella curvata]|uniref:Lectin-like protein BA14k n=1 Tax=Shinella curvata TaxID=1817964 RepID=A0ABT8XGF3_9HYPH|nr:BA14K family protein [Shinella curvata]MCJ8053118.1 BA14K family protein [Shinella curvata]MDO6122449.1 BA14K family protein [Shinella curvata]
MRFSGKCFALAMSALFAFTPVVPAGAMPLVSANTQPAGGQGDVQLVRNHDGRYEGRRVWRERRGDRHWRADRHHRRHWRGDRGYRHGWHRGHRGYRYARPGYRHHNGYWFPLAAFGAGAIIGGAIANDRGYVGGSSHVNWCANRYRSYRAYDNTFQPYGGPRRQCVSPYR